MNDLLQRAARHAGAAVLLATAVAAGAIGGRAMAQTPPATRDGPAADHAARVAHHVQEQLDRLADRLEIKASQQPAWQAFRSAFADTMTPHAEALKPGTEPDAATLARALAEHASAHAKQLSRLADATAKLQQALGPDQRAVLDEVARRFVHEHAPQGHGMRDGHGPWHGPGDGPGEDFHGERHHGDWGGAEHGAPGHEHGDGAGPGDGPPDVPHG
jgi:hypothetical protein